MARLFRSGAKNPRRTGPSVGEAAAHHGKQCKDLGQLSAGGSRSPHMTGARCLTCHAIPLTRPLVAGIVSVGFRTGRGVRMTSGVRILSALAVASVVWGCVTTVDVPTSTLNPPPASGLSAFRQIELVPIRFAPDVQTNDANQKALRKIQENVDAKIGPTLKAWNANPSARSNGQLVIEPVITELKFVSGGTRFIAGALAGSSAVVMRVHIFAKQSGDTIARPEFYQRAAAMGGAYSVGVTDNLMLTRIADLMTDYLQANYERPVGGRTGLGNRTTHRPSDQNNDPA